MLVFGTLPSSAPSDRVPLVPLKASAHWSFLVVPIEPRGALSVNSARVRIAQITLFEGSAKGVGVASHVSGAGADGGNISQLAVGVNAAGTFAGVLALVVVTSGFVSWAVAVMGAFGLARGEWVADVVRWALADRRMVPDCLANGVCTASRTGTLTFILHARLVVPAFRIAFAFMPASIQRRSEEPW